MTETVVEEKSELTAVKEEVAALRDRIEFDGTHDLIVDGSDASLLDQAVDLLSELGELRDKYGKALDALKIERDKSDGLQHQLEQERASAQALAAKYNATFKGLQQVGLVLDLTQAELERLG